MKKEIEYFILISLPDRIDDYVKSLKDFCKRNIGSFYSATSRSHISFGKFIDEEDDNLGMSEIMQLYLKNIQNAIALIPSCDLSIDGFNYFTHGTKFRTIYVVIKLDDNVIGWFDKIRNRLLIDRNITPHITIARKIPTNDFDILWPHFRNLTFKESFKPASLTILTREFSKQYIPYQKFGEIPFDQSDNSILKTTM